MLQSMFKMALGPNFRYLKTRTANLIVRNETLEPRDIVRFFQQEGLTATTFGEKFPNLINVVVEGHRTFWGGFYVPCDRNPHAINAQMIDEDEVVAPALVPDRPSPATVSRRSVRRAVSARQVTEAIFGTHLQRNAPGEVTTHMQDQNFKDAVTSSGTTKARFKLIH